MVMTSDSPDDQIVEISGDLSGGIPAIAAVAKKLQPDLLASDKLPLDISALTGNISVNLLSTTVVDAARRGLYPLDRARLTPPPLLKRHCLKGTGEYAGQLLVSRELRERVSFRVANLMQPLPKDLPAFDVIFLRNVLIYFETDAKAAIVRRVIERLKPGGVLYTGHAESLSMLGLPLRALAPAVHVAA